MPRCTPPVCLSAAKNPCCFRVGAFPAFSIPEPTTEMAMSIPHSWVDQCGSHVDEEGQHHHDDGDDDHDSLHRDEVATHQIVAERVAESLPLEGALGEDRSAQQQRCL